VNHPNVKWSSVKESGACERKGCAVHTYQWLALTSGKITREGRVCHTCRRDYIVGIRTEGEIDFVFREFTPSSIRAIDPKQIDGLQLAALGASTKL